MKGSSPFGGHSFEGMKPYLLLRRVVPPYQWNKRPETAVDAGRHRWRGPLHTLFPVAARALGPLTGGIGVAWR